MIIDTHHRMQESRVVASFGATQFSTPCRGRCLYLDYAPKSSANLPLSSRNVMSGRVSIDALTASIALAVIFGVRVPPLTSGADVPLFSCRRTIDVAVLTASPNILAASLMLACGVDCRYCTIRSFKSCDMVCLPRHRPRVAIPVNV
jgi:hypothetical protein